MRITPIKIEDKAQAKKLLLKLNISKEALDILIPKAMNLFFMIDGIRSYEANIIKQHLLSLGADAAIDRDAILKDKKLNISIFANLNQIKKLCEKLKDQPFRNLKEIKDKLSEYIDNYYKKDFVFKANNKILNININKPVICGIINITSDSFLGDGLLSISKDTLAIKDLALKKVEYMLKSEAKIIDLGGESSRPFSSPISEEEEIKRVIPVLRAIRKEFKDLLISIDTYKYKVAKAAVSEGVDIINDITGLKDKRIISLIDKHKLGCIIMHMKGTPKTMQIKPFYKDVIGEIFDFMRERLKLCYENNISKEQILIDPGIGFGKSLEDNLRIIKELYRFKVFGVPVFIGLSRKSFIGKILNLEVKDRLLGTIVYETIALLNGANVLRVHDVKETNQLVKLFFKYNSLL